MHFVTFVPVTVPKQEPNPDDNLRVQIQIELYKQALKKDPHNVLAKIYAEHCMGMATEFGRAVTEAVDIALEPYSENTENPDYLEFIDETADLKERYAHRTEDCIQLPDGKIVGLYEHPLRGRFEICDGKVYQKRFGQLKGSHRSKKAKKLKALTEYPMQKRYKTFVDFAKEYSIFYDEQDAYGYYCNPNSFYDWYVIGGRWPAMFLVKEDCHEYAVGDRGLDYEEPSAPDGYRWVVAARKKDIAWDEMMKWSKQKATEAFYKLEESFKCGEILIDGFVRLTDKGVESFSDLLYAAGESLEEYLVRHGHTEGGKYGCYPYGYLSDDGYKESCRYVHTPTGFVNEIEENEWHERVESFLDALPADTVIASVDCHV